MSREMLINVAQQEECRIAIVDKNQLEELYIERASNTTHVGNIYKGKITNVEPSIQACFVDFGIGQNGFLHISDLQPSYFPEKNGKKERVGRKRPRRDRPPIQECLKRNQEIIVQVIKEGIGTKGPTLTTYLSIPSRFLVLMPGMNKLGISRKIEDEKTRSKIKDILATLNAPKDLGFIVRTAGVGRGKRDLQRDMNLLLRLWKSITKKIKKESAPVELYRESDLVIRTVRDVFNANIKRILCDHEPTYKQIREFFSIAMPRSRNRVALYTGSTPLFSKYQIEQEIEKIQSSRVALKSGGSLVIDPTEALVAIDVNSGRYRVNEDAESTAFKINTEAAEEIARQLRLRDLGGVIVIDFIDMVQSQHRRSVEKTLRTAVAQDRARTKILRISQFGLIEMTRQRMRPSLTSSTYMKCPCCNGTGNIKTPESTALEVMRRIKFLMSRDDIRTIEIKVSNDVASFIQNKKRSLIAEMEKESNKIIIILAENSFRNNDLQFSALDNRGSTVDCKF